MIPEVRPAKISVSTIATAAFRRRPLPPRQMEKGLGGACWREKHSSGPSNTGVATTGLHVGRQPRPF